MTLEARDNDIRPQIFELTGIEPDLRSRIPMEEIGEMVHGIQDRNAQAMEDLVATRLGWIYKTYLQKDAVQQRHDLSPADVMEMGILATLEAAKSIDPDSPIVSALLQNKIPAIMGNLLIQTKLVPSLAEDGRKIRGLKHMKDDELIIDRILQTGISFQPDVHKEAGGSEYVLTDDDEEVRAEEIAGILDDRLNERSRYIIENRFGLSGEPKTLREIGDKINVTHERVRQIETEALETLHGAFAERPFTPRWTVEQRALQAEWFEELAAKREAREIAEQIAEEKVRAEQEARHIAQAAVAAEWREELIARQEAGEIVFVQGSLLKRPSFVR